MAGSGSGGRDQAVGVGSIIILLKKNGDATQSVISPRLDGQ